MSAVRDRLSRAGLDGLARMPVEVPLCTTRPSILLLPTPRKLGFVIQLRLLVDEAYSIVNSESPSFSGKAEIDALLLKLPGVSARKINGLDAYFVNDRMFACISGRGVGLRLPAATATELQFSRENVVPFQPGGMPSSREWIQIERAAPADYEKDRPLFLASIEFVKTSRSR